MEIYQLPSNIDYNNYEDVYKEIAKMVKKGQVKITLPQNLNSLTKAILRDLEVKYPKKLLLELPDSVRYSKDEDIDQTGGKNGTFLENLGDSLYQKLSAIYLFVVIMVEMGYYSFQYLFDRRFILKNDILKNSYYIGYKAIPISMLLSFLIGLTISVQAAVQMVKFGGQNYLALLIGVAMFKELGPLVTAIIIAGRTGSSIAAEIGTMVVMEEVDALQTMGVKPYKFLLVPKFWAFTLSMPILTLLATLAGVGGGLLIAMIYSVPPSTFIKSLIEAIKFNDVILGAVKSLTFAWVILAISSYKGLKVRGGSDAVGRATTDSVVISIFMVVIIDAFYSIILYTL